MRLAHAYSQIVLKYGGPHVRVALQLEKNKQSAADCCMPQLSPETFAVWVCVCVYAYASTY